jgi:hypothetical protein
MPNVVLAMYRADERYGNVSYVVARRVFIEVIDRKH